MKATGSRPTRPLLPQKSSTTRRVGRIVTVCVLALTPVISWGAETVCIEQDGLSGHLEPVNTSVADCDGWIAVGAEEYRYVYRGAPVLTAENVSEITEALFWLFAVAFTFRVLREFIYKRK